MRMRPLVVCAVVSFLPVGSWAMSAAPVDLRLIQADDGAMFTATPRGNEHGDWTETPDGFSIVEGRGVWYYAEQRPDGTLGATLYRANLPPPQTRAPWPKHLRPALGAIEERHPFSLNAPRADARTLVRTQPLLTILVSFSNVAFTYPDASFQALIHGASNSVSDFYRENSYGGFTITPAAESFGTANDGIVHVTMGAAHPNFGNSSSQWRTVVGAYIAAADPFVNFADFDTNANGVVTSSELSIMLILGGYENSYGGAASPTPRVWGHQQTLSAALTLDGKSVSPYAAVGERHSTHQSTIGIMCHELGHLIFALPDLYDDDGSSYGIGNWGLMGGGGWNFVTTIGDSPAHLDAWCKTIVGMTTPEDVNSPSPGSSILEASANPSIKRVWSDPFKSPRGEYFLIENRQLNGYDSGLPGAGLLLWHIDGSRANNQVETRKWVDVEEADGLAQMDLLANLGDAGDPFPGSIGNMTFNASTNPSSDDYAGEDTGIVVSNISASGPAMTADITPRSGLGESLYYNEQGWTFNLGASNKTIWTALRLDNASTADRLEGFEVYLNDTSATIDFYLYQNLTGTTPTTLVHTQAGFAAVRGWNRFMLATPQNFPQAATRVMVLRIAAASYLFPAAADGYGVNSGRSYLDSDGVGAFSLASYDLSQTALLGRNQQAIIFVNFSHVGTEAGTVTNPFNSFAEGLVGVLEGGIINVNGFVADTLSSWTGTIGTPLVLTANPAGPVRIGVMGGGS